MVVAAVAGWLMAAAGLGRWPRSLGIAAVVGAYVVFSGVQPSAVRAWVMAMAASAAWVGGRRTDGGSTLAVAAAVVLAVSPVSAFDLGFRLVGRRRGRTGSARATRHRVDRARAAAHSARARRAGLADAGGHRRHAADHRADVSDAVARLAGRQHPVRSAGLRRAARGAGGAGGLRRLAGTRRRRARRRGSNGRARCLRRRHGSLSWPHAADTAGVLGDGRLRDRGRGDRVGLGRVADARRADARLRWWLRSWSARCCSLSGRASARDRRSRCSTSGRATRSSFATAVTRCSSTPARRRASCAPRSRGPAYVRSTAWSSRTCTRTMRVVCPRSRGW